MATIRQDALVTGEVYHIYSRSIAGFEIFRSQDTYDRFVAGLTFYNQEPLSLKFSSYLELSPKARGQADLRIGGSPIVQIIAFCVMPTHIHLVIKQIEAGGISQFMGNVLNSFTRFFNLSHNRRGPLWESRFKNVLVEDDQQLLHLSRYVHLNPVSAGLVKEPDDWPYSSYAQYAGLQPDIAVCNWQDVIDFQPKEYQQFVRSRISYQRSLTKIKHLLIDNYTG
jgi:putative transposase